MKAIDFEEQFHLAMLSYDDGEFEKGFKEFSDLALSMFIGHQTENLDQIEKAMEMAVACYQEKYPSLFTEQSIDNLFSQFFKVIRHSMDYAIETDPIHVQEKITREIPLGIPEERVTIFPENSIGFEEGRADPYNIYVTTAQGPRQEMEDEHLFSSIVLKKRECQLFGVFDGHGGIGCSLYVKKKLPEYLENAFQSLPSFSDLEIYNALRHAFINLDHSWAVLPFQYTSNRDYSGSTAAVALVLEKEIWVASVGDSRVVLANGKTPIQLSEDAKPTVEKYSKEIFRRGGDISGGRVVGMFGTLDMARSIGDIDQPSVSALPSIRKFSLDQLQEPSYLILACDGLWDVVSPQLAVDVCQKSSTIQEAAEKLKQVAFLRGTTDNVTIMVVDLSIAPH